MVSTNARELPRCQWSPPRTEPAVAAVQSLSMPMATVSPIVRVKSPCPRASPKTVRQALLFVWVVSIAFETFEDSLPGVAPALQLRRGPQGPADVVSQAALPGDLGKPDLDGF